MTAAPLPSPFSQNRGGTTERGKEVGASGQECSVDSTGYFLSLTTPATQPHFYLFL